MAQTVTFALKSTLSPSCTLGPFFLYAHTISLTDHPPITARLHYQEDEFECISTEVYEKATMCTHPLSMEEMLIS